MIPLLAIIVGLLIGLFVTVSLPSVAYTYLALVILCTFDSLIGGVKARYARRYSNRIFLSGWIGNVAVAVLMNAAGDALGIDLALPVMILLGMRIFNNVAGLRRLWLRRVEKRQRTIRVWMEKTGQAPEDLPIETASGEITERQKRVDELRNQARRLRLEADSLLNEADVLFEQEAMSQLLRQRAQEEGKTEASSPGQSAAPDSGGTEDAAQVSEDQIEDLTAGEAQAQNGNQHDYR